MLRPTEIRTVRLGKGEQIYGGYRPRRSSGRTAGGLALLTTFIAGLAGGMLIQEVKKNPGWPAR